MRRTFDRQSAILIGDCTLPVTYISTEATFDMKVSSVEKLPHTQEMRRTFDRQSAILIGDCTLPVTYISTEATFDMKVSSVEKLPHTSRDAKNF
ncbi:hypothetical protein TVAGG3_0417810 [Trichomonas vaginalis G3]|uniref:hypothetical protein n=1 Tax=Trichomonas vaginalis (strain ATCC PRA-98 / G3) TaxID=412133 RepID=UPI0021E5DF6C|nr:hypothetical protein TVAGG3_0305750 [Trichomonas vaginalis G3]XP_051103044.1 hypothetical protein TVAGG3_0417760 [Trichomonas vaginalis G3]XP_051103048.1 hypothetical protein TVAGG3_0417810 [Trichomonas vaginalis G3]KAI5528241.1 hypothetical protein TVAGG3_0305750 [Trichomonas vaginalis G3]KAI5535816.1 hypothetical protein TVAGG3_0417760 [Trichomonas vaginalis G3]KAI5535820.1 hypothetical protein TVAGG3_0417810 [Trichomonas vaginalis G3]